MKLSCSSALLAGAGAQSLDDMVVRAAALGVNGILLDLPATHHDPAAFSFRASAQLVLHAQANAIEWHCVHGAPCAAGRGAQQGEELKRLVCIAHALACPLVSFTAPAAALDDAYDGLVAMVQDAVDIAQDLDICLAIEPAADTLIRTADHAVDFVDDVACRNLGIVYNPGTLAQSGGEEPAAAVAMLRDYLLLVCLQGADLLAIQRNEFDHAVRVVQRTGYHEYYADCSVCATADPPPYVLEQITANARHMRGMAL
jgi:sugar phosphate isomerase/epimerase